MKKHYIFFDIDGTLVAGGYGNDYIPESTKLALKKLREKGHFLAIATGRAQAMAVDYMKELGFENMVSDGGYGLTINGELKEIQPLEKEKVVDVINEAKKKGIPWGLQLENSDIRDVPDESFYEYTHDKYIKSRIRPGLDPSKCEKIYKAYLACSYPAELSLESLKYVPWCRFHEKYFFIEPSDKAFGIKRVMDYFGADYKDVVVFGDAKNDISMFRDPWLKVAMGNAIPELKELADFVTDDVDKDGIFNACKKLSLF